MLATAVVERRESHIETTSSRQIFKSGEEQSHLVDQFQLRSGYNVAAELSFRVFHNEQGDPFEKPIVVVHKALTGTTRAFTNEEKTQGDGWANHLQNLKHFNLNQQTILVVEPLGGNASGLTETHLSSGRQFLEAGEHLTISSYDTVNLLKNFLHSQNVKEIDTIFCFSMGGIMLPAWVEQKDLPIKSIQSIFSNYQLTPATQEYWQIQKELLDLSGGAVPNFHDLAQRLRNNFGNPPAEQNTFAHCVQYLAGKVAQLEVAHRELDREAYLLEALKVVRGVSFLRFQTRETYNQNDFQKSRSFLDAQGACFPERMDPINYLSLLNLMLDPTFPDHQYLGSIKSPNLRINYILACDDMLFPPNTLENSEVYSLSSKFAIINTNRKGHDGFLSKCFPSVVRHFL